MIARFSFVTQVVNYELSDLVLSHAQSDEEIILTEYQVCLRFFPIVRFFKAIYTRAGRQSKLLHNTEAFIVRFATRSGSKHTGIPT